MRVGSRSPFTNLIRPWAILLAAGPAGALPGDPQTPLGLQGERPITAAAFQAAANLDKAVFPGKAPYGDLQDADFRGKSLLGTVLAGTDCRRARFDGVDLRQADLGGAVLDGATFNGAKLLLSQQGGAGFSKADLSGALWYHASGDEVPVAAWPGGSSGRPLAVNLPEEGFDNESRIERKEASPAADPAPAPAQEPPLGLLASGKPILTRSGLVPLRPLDQAVFLPKANLRDVDFSDKSLGGADLGAADCSGARLTGLDLTTTVLKGAALAGADFTGARVRAEDVPWLEAQGADLGRAVRTPGLPDPCALPPEEPGSARKVGYDLAWYRGYRAAKAFWRVRGTGNVTKGTRVGPIDLGVWRMNQRGRAWNKLMPWQRAALEAIPQFVSDGRSASKTPKVRPLPPAQAIPQPPGPALPAAPPQLMSLGQIQGVPFGTPGPLAIAPDDRPLWNQAELAGRPSLERVVFLPGADVCGITFSSKDIHLLKHADLGMARCDDADFSGLDLRTTVLDGIQCRGARFLGAILRRKDYEWAKIMGADLRGAFTDDGLDGLGSPAPVEPAAGAPRWHHDLRALKTFYLTRGHCSAPAGHRQGATNLDAWMREHRRMRNDLPIWKVAALGAFPGLVTWLWKAPAVDPAAAPPAPQAPPAGPVGILAGAGAAAGPAPMAAVAAGPARGVKRPAPQEPPVPAEAPVPAQPASKKPKPVEDDWAALYHALGSYAARHGQADPPLDHVEEGLPLGAWAAAQRLLGKRRDPAITPLQVLALTALPGWSWEGPLPMDEPERPEGAEAPAVSPAPGESPARPMLVD